MPPKLKSTPKKGSGFAGWKIALIVIFSVIVVAAGVGFAFPVWYTIGKKKDDDKECTQDDKDDMDCVQKVLESEGCCSGTSECAELYQKVSANEDISSLLQQCTNLETMQADWGSCQNGVFPENWKSIGCSAYEQRCACALLPE